MKNFSFSERAQYSMDSLLSRGTSSLLIGLAFAAIFVVILVSAILILFNLQPHDGSTTTETIWTTFMHVYDPSQIAYDEGTWVYKAIIFLACLGGIFILSTLIGVLTTGFDNRLQELRKGRSLVVERGHVLILGWSEQIFPIISELMIANENQRDACIVILAEKDKVEMEDEIRTKIPNRKNLKIVCRTGSPIEFADQKIVSPELAKSIIILPPESENPDSYVIKALLALINNPQRTKEKFNIVAGIHNRKNLDVARIIGRDEVVLVPLDEIISQIVAQTCRQPGLSVVYTELLDFDGDEIYFHEEKNLAGKSFDEAIFCFEDSTIIGLEQNGLAFVKPPMETKISPGDRIIAISRDDDTIIFSEKNFSFDENLFSQKNSSYRSPERTLILGLNQRIQLLLRELDKYIRPGSYVLNITKDFSSQELLKMTNADLELREGDPTDRALLDEIRCDKFDNIIVLSNFHHENIQDADAETLITLVHLRDIMEKTKAKFSIVSEMLDDRNRELAKITSTNDFIVSSKISSLLLTQLSENRALLPVLNDLFDADGAEIYLKPAGDYIQPGVETNFYSVLEAARRKDEIAIGYKKGGSNSASNVHLNPRKSERISFSEGDQIIVIAEE